MDSTVTFINPNEPNTIERCLPKILAQAIINAINNQRINSSTKQ